MKKQPKTYIFYLGIGIFSIGMLLKFIFPEAGGVMLRLPMVLTGCGSGIIGVGAANIIRKKRIENDPGKAKQYEISEKDERNARIREKAGYAAWYTTLLLLGILSMIFVVLNNLAVCLITLGAMLIHAISLFAFIHVYNKRI